ncbi:sugar ABC transporter permease [Pseudoclavibacter chungangensis]|uniref:Sugar ABC transporter permease n=1 Tax=Pseudoclavibacter chungangensis TaxID=587635 RepID=A0A7J5C0S7_9MICO|nr:sugar ABC transporter permease [Pseudoclavibacter chungangensis]KAB1660053.1 sugar ABC transporter permease [Pseudoclavibacter chungangensis]NYJ66851.1 multiple sugar transport system permease protein [Pseudoclavibacter chungangensis]
MTQAPSETEAVVLTTGTPDRRRRDDGRWAWALIAPTLLILAIVIGYPIVQAVRLAFQADEQLDPATGFFEEGGFAGGSNFVHWLMQDCGGGAGSCPPGTLGSEFWSAIGVTFFFTIVTVTLEVALGFWFATIMGKNLWGRSVIRASVLVPWAIPTAVTAKLWYFMFADNGIVNSVLGQQIPWMTGVWESRFAVIVADVWKTTPFVALLILAGLQMIPKDVYEAARMDGASRWQQFTRITLPLVRPALMVAILFRVLDALRMYDLPAIMQGASGGSPTTTMSILVTADMRQGNFNSASALSTLVFLVIFLVAFVMVKFLGANAVDQTRAGARPATKEKTS